MSNRHTYKTNLIWDGNLGDGTATYQGYGRQHRILVDGKPELRASADPIFRGAADAHNPEDLFLAAVSSCHMLSYLALCARNSINVLDYRDEATGELVLDARGGGKFEEIVLRPVVTIAKAADRKRAMELHEQAHAVCFIANSCSVPIHHRAEIRT